MNHKDIGIAMVKARILKKGGLPHAESLLGRFRSWYLYWRKRGDISLGPSLQRGKEMGGEE